MSERESLGMTEEQLARVAARAVRLYAETHPRPTQVTQRQAAEILGVAPRTVRRYIRSGKMKLNRSGYLAIEAVDAMRSSQ